MISKLVLSTGVDAAYAGKLTAFVELFEKWNRKINLSAASSTSDVEEHLEDSLHVVPLLQSSSRILDVGSGGGFPVVIAAICLPNSAFVSLEPVHKKHAFLRTAARELQLPNLEPLAIRADAHDIFDYDAAMSRATFDLAEWLDLGARHVHPGGIVIGFEAQERDDLGAIHRTRYSLRGKQRALVQRSV